MDGPTESIPLPRGGPVPPLDDTWGEPVAAPRPRRRRRGLLIVAAVVGLLAVLYVGDLLLSAGSVPRGVTVAGLAVGGLSTADAEQQLRTQIEPRTIRPVAVSVGEVRSEIDPRAAGLTVNWTATLEQAGSQPLNPITRITSFFTQREVGVVTAADPQLVSAALEQLAPVVDRPPAEGTVRFDGVTPVPVDPVPGQRLDVPAAGQVLQREWANGASGGAPALRPGADHHQGERAHGDRQGGTTGRVRAGHGPR